MLSIEQILQENQGIVYYKKDLSMIKNAWLKSISQIQPKNAIDYYFMGMAKIAIVLLNEVKVDLFLNHCCHKGLDFQEIVADNRARDLCELYRSQYLSYDQTISILDNYSPSEQYYFLVRLVYPSFYFSLSENMQDIYQLFLRYRQQISEIHYYLSDKIDFPSFVW